ncbi:hypothetical protein FHG87_007763 [Trinorchestia longiramus]|nr:hypothetical protein FHG87_007763 [Trinorchestia longiramus]
MPSSNGREVQYTFSQKSMGKFKLLGPYIACLALILSIVIGIFTIHNWLLYKGLVVSQDKIILNFEEQRAAQTKFLSELTDLMSQQEQNHQYSLQELEQKMKKSLEERGYNTAHFNSSVSRPLPACALVLAGIISIPHLMMLVPWHTYLYPHLPRYLY